MVEFSGRFMNWPLSDFTELPFPSERDIVYVLCFVKLGQLDPVPFYVGESSRHIGRFGDYVSANFSASTDFKVGEGVKFLRQLGFPVLIKYRETTRRKLDEASLITALKSQGFMLLNDLKGYDYRSAVAENERRRVHSFIETLVGQCQGSPS
jgi:hypothetical protein